MRTSFIYGILVVAAVLGFSLAARAQSGPCTPSTVAPVTICRTKPCSSTLLGKTTLDGDSVNIIACLYTDDTQTQTVWKSMTVSNELQLTEAVPASGLLEVISSGPVAEKTRSSLTSHFVCILTHVEFTGADTNCTTSQNANGTWQLKSTAGDGTNSGEANCGMSCYDN